MWGVFLIIFYLFYLFIFHIVNWPKNAYLQPFKHYISFFWAPVMCWIFLTPISMNVTYIHRFIPPEKSADKRPKLMVTGRVSGTITIYQIRDEPIWMLLKDGRSRGEWRGRVSWRCSGIVVHSLESQSKGRWFESQPDSNVLWHIWHDINPLFHSPPTCIMRIWYVYMYEKPPLLNLTSIESLS